MSNNKSKGKWKILPIDYSDEEQMKHVTSAACKVMFNWKQYMKHYSDLDVKNLHEAWSHWLNYGLREKRFFFLYEENEYYKKKVHKEESKINVKNAISDAPILENTTFSERLVKNNNFIHKNIYDNYGTHYFGWKEAINSFITQIDKDDKFREPIFFDEWIEKLLIWGDKMEKKFYLNEIYQNEYKLVTFIHNPPFKKWYEEDYKKSIKNKIIYDDEHSNRALVKTIHKHDLENQLMYLYTLTNQHKEYLYKKCPQLRTKLMSIHHPIDINRNEKCFNLSLFCKNKQIFHIGWWLRNFDTFIQFKQPKDYYKNILIKNDFEQEWIKLSGFYKLNDINIIKEMNNNDYEKIFTNSCIFIHLEDSCATNTVLECMKFNTPLIINKLQSVVEYLGEDYPLYFQNDEELLLLNNPSFLLFKMNEAHEYLSKLNKTSILLETFHKKLNYDFKKLEVVTTQLTWFCLIDTLVDIDNTIVHLYNTFITQVSNSRLLLHIVICETLNSDPIYESVLERLTQYSDAVFNINFSIKKISNKYNEFLDYCLEICETKYIVTIDPHDEIDAHYSDYCMNYLDSTPTSDAIFSSYKITNNKGYNENFIFDKEFMVFYGNYSTTLLPETGIVWRTDIKEFVGNFAPLHNRNIIFREFWLRVIKNNFNIKCCSVDILYTNILI